MNRLTVQTWFSCALALLGVISLGLVATSAASAGLRLVPLSVPQLLPGAGGSHFARLSPDVTGVALVQKFPASGAFELLQDQGGGNGVCIADFDGDGLPDLFITDYDRGNHLYRNRGDWHFQDVTVQAGVAGGGRWCSGASVADIDNDGDLDLHVAVYSRPNLLFVNRGNGTFDEKAADFGLAFSGASVSMAFADYDQDGNIDGYLLTHRLAVGSDFKLPRSSQDSFARGVVEVGENRTVTVNPRFSELFEIIPKGAGRMELIIAGQPDRLFRGNGSGKFSEVAAGIRGNEIGLAATWWDYNQDGWEDLYVSNDYKGSDRLYRNNGDGTFADVAAATLPHVPWSSMGADAADINNDGVVDFIATDMSGSTHARRMMIHSDEKERWFLRVANPRQYSRNAVYLGTGTERVMEVAFLCGLASTDWTWSPKFADFDNDGWTDLFIANGMAHDFVNADLLRDLRDRSNRNWLRTPVLKEANRVYRNLGDLRFVEVSADWGLDVRAASYGAAVADLDRDGDLDLVITSIGEPVMLFRNDSVRGHRLLVRLKGQRSNVWGLGASVRIEAGGLRQCRTLTSTSGFLSANEPLVHFGLGPAASIDRLTVTWPGGTEQSFTNIAADQLLIIEQPVTQRLDRSARAAARPWFRASNALGDLKHQEQEFDEFVREPLLPWGLSQLGPGLALGDVDDDGVEDFYLGGASGQVGTLVVHRSGGTFAPQPTPAWEASRLNEDMGALLFDADGDGDLDLYVVSGGVECAPDDALLNDRLYLNDRRGVFRLAAGGSVPEDRSSGSFVAAADFDRDGDLDLFVGGRCVAGRYPSAPKSALLRNDGGKFVDITARVAPAMGQTGMVTSGLWSDVDGDGWLDLLVAHEWGPVDLFLNRAGQFEKRTEASGLTRWLGFWNGIAGGDVDGDGDIDYVVTNLGLNTKYQASAEQPLLGFLGDFDESGNAQFIETEYDGEALVPSRTKSALGVALPSILSRYPTHASFAHVTVAELLGARALAAAQRFTVNTLESGLLVNDGHGHFTFRPLPRLAQVAPAFGVTLTDFDADGTPDVFLAHNFSGPEPETGNMDGGLGLLLRGQGNGTFNPIRPRESGLAIPGNGRGVSVADVNQDGRPDLIVSMNNGPVKLYENHIPSSNRFLRLRLQGPAGNLTGIGAMVSVTRVDGRRQVQELYAGGGYLAQSSRDLFFGLGTTGSVVRIDVRWPDGTRSVSQPTPESTALILRPAAR